MDNEGQVTCISDGIAKGDGLGQQSPCLACQYLDARQDNGQRQRPAQGNSPEVRRLRGGCEDEATHQRRQRVVAMECSIGGQGLTAEHRVNELGLLEWPAQEQICRPCSGRRAGCRAPYSRPQRYALSQAEHHASGGRGLLPDEGSRKTGGVARGIKRQLRPGAANKPDAGPFRSPGLRHVPNPGKCRGPVYRSPARDWKAMPDRRRLRPGKISCAGAR